MKKITCLIGTIIITIIIYFIPYFNAVAVYEEWCEEIRTFLGITSMFELVGIGFFIWYKIWEDGE